MIPCARLVLLGALTAAPMACESSSASAAAATERARASLHVEGMACDSCAARLAKELREVDGVLAVDVAFADERATIDYDATRLTRQKLVEAVEKIGFEASVDSSSNGE